MKSFSRPNARMLQGAFFACVIVASGCQSLPPDRATTMSTANGDSEVGFETKAGTSNDIVRATPYYVGGEHFGYRLSPIADEGSFKALGLERWDLLLEVDGRPLANQTALKAFLDRLDHGDSVRAKIDRGGEIIFVVLGPS